MKTYLTWGSFLIGGIGFYAGVQMYITQQNKSEFRMLSSQMIEEAKEAGIGKNLEIAETKEQLDELSDEISFRRKKKLKKEKNSKEELSGPDWSYINKNASRISAIIIPDATLYGKAKMQDNDMGDVKFSSTLQKYISPTPIKEVLRLMHAPYHGPIVALLVDLEGKRSGWVDGVYYYPRSKVVNVRSDDVLNVREKATYKSAKVSTIKPGGYLYYSAYDANSFESKGCESDFVRVVTIDGVFGYVNCRYVKALN